MNTPELKKWLRENSAGVYRPAAEAADLIEDMEHQRDAAVMLAGELIAIIRVNAMRGWAEATPEQVYEFLAPWIEKLRVAQGHSPDNAIGDGRRDGCPTSPIDFPAVPSTD